MSAIVAAAARRATSRRAPALAVVTGRTDAPLLALCAKVQADFAVVGALEGDPRTPSTRLIRLCDGQNALLAEVAATRAVTRAGRRAKAALAVDALQPDNLAFLDAKIVMDFLEGLARDMLAEGVL